MPWLFANKARIFFQTRFTSCVGCRSGNVLLLGVVDCLIIGMLAWAVLFLRTIRSNMTFFPAFVASEYTTIETRIAGSIGSIFVLIVVKAR